jgi:hypothetical protein
MVDGQLQLLGAIKVVKKKRQLTLATDYAITFFRS